VIIGKQKNKGRQNLLQGTTDFVLGNVFKSRKNREEDFGSKPNQKPTETTDTSQQGKKRTQSIRKKGQGQKKTNLQRMALKRKVGVKRMMSSNENLIAKWGTGGEDLKKERRTQTGTKSWIE